MLILIILFSVFEFRDLIYIDLVFSELLHLICLETLTVYLCIYTVVCKYHLDDTKRKGAKLFPNSSLLEKGYTYIVLFCPPKC